MKSGFSYFLLLLGLFALPQLIGFLFVLLTGADTPGQRTLLQHVFVIEMLVGICLCGIITIYSQHTSTLERIERKLDELLKKKNTPPIP